MERAAGGETVIVAGARKIEQRGFALLIVLWSLGLLALLGATVTAAGRSETRVAHDLAANAAVQTAADGGVAEAAFHLMDASGRHWTADGVPHRQHIGDCDVTLTLIDQRGKVDVNETPPGLVAALLARQGVDTAGAAAIAHAIVDWRSPADTGLGQSYAAKRARYAPPHEDVQTLDELSLVLGVSQAVLDAARPHLSVDLGAPPIAALADTLVGGAMQDAAKSGQLQISTADQQNSPLVVLVRSTARKGNASFTREATLRFDAGDVAAWHVLDWAGP